MLDPGTESRFRIEPDAKIATIGSCFAQHLSRHLVASGLNHFVAEPAPPGMRCDVGEQLGYGQFSARYGNVYTVKQALQLFDRAFGHFQPHEEVWELDGRWVDPFRPSVQPEGFTSCQELLEDRQLHLAAVRRVFTETDVLVLTLGLTEAWRSRRDGAVFGAAPGVRGGSYVPDSHEFVNFGIQDVVADLDGFVRQFHSVNPAGRILLTVSPVPLIATWENRHVLVSTVASKSILRVAVEEMLQKFDFVDYFPSYEIISAPGNAHYFDDDLRSIKEIGVAHVMRVFTKHVLAGSSSERKSSVDFLGEAKSWGEVVCDEIEIVRSLA